MFIRKNNSIQSNKRSLKSLLILLLLFINNFQALSSSYYVNNNNGSDTNAGSENFPWETLKPLKNLHFYPGDHIFFARGSNFTGGFIVSDSGNENLPIIFTAYGKGAAPKFTNPDYSILNGNVFQIKGSYIIIDGLHFHDGTQSISDKFEVVLRVGDVYVAKGADHIVIRNCEVRNSPIGFNLNGQFAMVTHNHLHDCNRFLADTSWGPIAIMISNANNEISYNRITNYIAIGGPYGADGGALEIFTINNLDTIRNINIHHNYSYGNLGFLEVGVAKNGIHVAYNISNDYQQFVILFEGGKSVFENNTILRVLPKITITDVVFTFKESGNIIRNNIFVLNFKRQALSANGTEVRGRNNYAGQKRQNNIYFSIDGTQQDPCGLPLSEGEMVVNPGFVDFAKQDYHLRPGSPAIDAGVDSGSDMDFDGKKVPMGKTRDIGAFEYIKTTLNTDYDNN